MTLTGLWREGCEVAKRLLIGAQESNGVSQRCLDRTPLCFFEVFSSKEKKLPEVDLMV